MSTTEETPAQPLPMPERLALANKVMDDTVRNSLRFRWLQEEATAEQWERASHALDAGAEVDAMMVCR